MVSRTVIRKFGFVQRGLERNKDYPSWATRPEQRRGGNKDCPAPVQNTVQRCRPCHSCLWIPMVIVGPGRLARCCRPMRDCRHHSSLVNTGAKTLRYLTRPTDRKLPPGANSSQGPPRYSTGMSMARTSSELRSLIHNPEGHSRNRQATCPSPLPRSAMGRRLANHRPAHKALARVHSDSPAYSMPTPRGCSMPEPSRKNQPTRCLLTEWTRKFPVVKAAMTKEANR